MEAIEKKYLPGSIAVQFEAGLARTQAEKILLEVGVSSFFGGYVKEVLFATVPVGSEEEIVRSLAGDPRVQQAQRNLDLHATYPGLPRGCGIVE